MKIIILGAGQVGISVAANLVNEDNDRGSPIIEVIQGGLGDAAENFEGIAHETTEETGIRHTL